MKRLFVALVLLSLCAVWSGSAAQAPDLHATLDKLASARTRLHLEHQRLVQSFEALLAAKDREIAALVETKALLAKQLGLDPVTLKRPKAELLEFADSNFVFQSPVHQTFYFNGSKADIVKAYDAVCVGEVIADPAIARCVPMADLLDFIATHGEESK